MKLNILKELANSCIIYFNMKLNHTKTLNSPLGARG